MMWTERNPNLFVFWNGVPIYKRRMDSRGRPTQTGGYIFDAFGPPWMPVEFDHDMERLAAPNDLASAITFRGMELKENTNETAPPPND